MNRFLSVDVKCTGAKTRHHRSRNEDFSGYKADLSYCHGGAKRATSLECQMISTA